MTPPESSTSPAPTVIVRPATAADLPRIGRLGALLVERITPSTHSASSPRGPAR